MESKGNSFIHHSFITEKPIIIFQNANDDESENRNLPS